jgi:hypothetical protein
MDQKIYFIEFKEELRPAGSLDIPTYPTKEDLWNVEATDISPLYIPPKQRIKGLLCLPT